MGRKPNPYKQVKERKKSNIIIKKFDAEGNLIELAEIRSRSWHIGTRTKGKVSDKSLTPNKDWSAIGDTDCQCKFCSKKTWCLEYLERRTGSDRRKNKRIHDCERRKEE